MAFGRPSSKKSAPKLAEHELLAYALKILSVRGYSEKELRAKLTTRAAQVADIEIILAKLNEYGYVNDQRFAIAIAASKRDNEGFGKERILRDLRTRKVSGVIAETAVAEVLTGVEENDQIRQFLTRKYRGKDLSAYLKEQKNLASAYRRLRYAGFSHGKVVTVLKGIAAGTDEFLDQLESEPLEEAEQ